MLQIRIGQYAIRLWNKVISTRLEYLGIVCGSCARVGDDNAMTLKHIDIPAQVR